MKKFSLLLLLCSALAVAGLGQVRPNEFIEETNPNNTNFETYSQKGGVSRRASLANLRKYFGATIVTGTAPAPTGNAESLRNRMVLVLPDSVTYFVDHTGTSLRLGGGQVEVQLLEGPPDTLCIDDNCVVLADVPASLPPSGPAGGSLTGTYPNPGLGVNVVEWNILSAAARDSILARLTGLGTVGTYPVWTAARRLADGRLANITGGVQVIGSNVVQLGSWTLDPAGVAGGLGYRSDLGVLRYYDGVAAVWRSIQPSTATAGQVVFAGANGLLSGSNNLWWDAVNNRLGVRTSSPPATLSVVGATSGASNFALDIRNSAGGVILQARDDGRMSFGTTISATRNYIFNGTIQANEGIWGSSFFLNGVGGSFGYFGLDANTGMLISGGDVVLRSYASSIIFQRSNGSVNIGRVNTLNSRYNGNIACETITGPESGDWVFSSNFVISGGASGRDLVIKGGDDKSAGSGVSSVSGDLILQGGRQNPGTLASSWDNGTILFQTAPNTSGAPYVNRGAIIPNGFWGVGNVNPSQQLHVTGNVRITGAYFDSNNTAGSAQDVLRSNGAQSVWTAQRNNIFSGTTDASGDITITFASAMPDATYSAIVTLESHAAWIVQVHSKTTTTCKVRFYQSTTGLEVGAGNSAEVSYQVTDY